MNNKAILKDNVHVQFKEWSNKKLKFQDQDILMWFVEAESIIYHWNII